MSTALKGHRSFPLHPVIFALLPVLFLYAYNIRELYLSELPLPLLVAAVASLAVWALLRGPSGIGSAPACWLRSSGSGFADSVRCSEPHRGTSSAVLLTALVLYALTWPALTVFALRRRWAGHHLSSALNIMALVLLAFQLVRIGSFECKRLQAAPPPPDPALQLLSSTPQVRPNIYFIVLDGYAREDVIARALRIRQYGVPTRSSRPRAFKWLTTRTNYCQTVLSLSSCLNLGYLDGLARAMGPNAVDRTPLPRAVDHNETTRFLRSQGYQIVAFASGYEGTAK